MMRQIFVSLAFLMYANFAFAYITENVTGGCNDDIAFMHAIFTPNEYDCAAGEYMPANHDGCVVCPADSYCPGGHYVFNPDAPAGNFPCPVGYDHDKNAGKTDISMCKKRCEDGTFLLNDAVLFLDGFYNTPNGNNPDADKWYDLSPNQNHGKFFGNVTYDPINHGYIFTNNANYVETINSLGLRGAIVGTIEIVATWYGTAFSGINGMFTFGPDTGTSLTAEPDALCSVNSCMWFTAPQTNTMFTMSFVIPNGNMSGTSVWLNGQAHAISTINLALNIPQTKMQIGRYWQWAGQNRTFNGIIHAVRVYNRVLTPDELVRHYEQDKLRFADNGLTMLDYGTKCDTCPENSYCPAKTYNFGDDAVATKTQCPDGTFSPAGMWEVAQCGHILHIGDNKMYLRATKKTTPALNFDFNNDGTPDWFGNMTIMDVPMNINTDKKLKLEFDNVTYSAYDDTVTPGNKP